MLLLPHRICSGQDRPRLAEPELELPEQPLALAHSQLDSVGLVDPCRQCLAIPQIHPHSRIARLGPQNPIDLLHLLFVQPTGTTGPFSFRQASQALLVKTMNPILDRTRRVAQQAGHLRARQALRYQEDTVQPVVVPRLLRPLNFLLQTQHRSGIGYHEWSHDSRRARSGLMRNYL